MKITTTQVTLELTGPELRALQLALRCFAKVAITDLERSHPLVDSETVKAAHTLAEQIVPQSFQAHTVFAPSKPTVS